ncbi:MAG: hypothetical protein IH940_12710, partial [Acidobacteria bacterium]|nr:hypothetical protein [Acidobacteriota bacterium]
MQHDTRKTTRAVRVLAAAALAATLGLTVTTAGAEPDIDDARSQRDDARAAQAAAVDELELLEAEDDEVAAAIDGMQLAVDNQRARVEAARALVKTTEAEAKRLRALAKETAKEVELARDEARSQAVDAFIGVGIDDAAYWLTEQDPSQAARMVELLRVVSGNNADSIDALRDLELTQTVLIETADEAEREASNARDALEVELAERQRRVDTQRNVKGELETRIVDWEAQVAEFEATEAALTDRIQELQTLALGTTDHTPGAASLRGFIKPVA